MANRFNDKAKFVGQVTASVTHELQNILAIIKENSGLMEDLLLIHRSAEPELAERLSKSISSILSQVSRGVELTSDLNYFSHTTDYQESEVYPDELIRKLIVIAGRLIARTNTDVEFAPSDTQPVIRTDPVMFQQLVFSCLECIIMSIPDETSIMVTLLEVRCGIEISFVCQTTRKPVNEFSELIQNSPLWEDIESLCMRLGANPNIDNKSPLLILDLH